MKLTKQHTLDGESFLTDRSERILWEKKMRDIIRKFLIETPPYDPFDQDNVERDVEDIFDNTVWVIENTKEVPEKKDFPSGYGCPTCQYDEFPDNCPVDFYVGSNDVVYPKRSYSTPSNDYTYDSWTETHFCPICKKEFSYDNSSG